MCGRERGREGEGGERDRERERDDIDSAIVDTGTRVKYLWGRLELTNAAPDLPLTDVRARDPVVLCRVA
jgi:hypothetical protein